MRAKSKKQRDRYRTQHHHQIKQLRLNERVKVWDAAFYDEELDEVVNRLKCEWVPILKAEVLIDSRLRGAFQRID